jgi:hypothetical protein
MEITRHEGSALQLQPDSAVLRNWRHAVVCFSVPHPISSPSSEFTRPARLFRLFAIHVGETHSDIHPAAVALDRREPKITPLKDVGRSLKNGGPGGDRIVVNEQL